MWDGTPIDDDHDSHKNQFCTFFFNGDNSFKSYTPAGFDLATRSSEAETIPLDHAARATHFVFSFCH
jgi:hypothetical protein